MKVQHLSKDAITPTRGSSEAAGYDLYYSRKQVIDIGSERRVLIPTDIALEIPVGYVGIIKPRSGLAYKHGLDVLAGVIDSDYRGNIGVVIQNEDSVKSFTVESGMRIAQIVFIKHESVEFEEVEDFGSTERGDGGYGSTGL
jgi:dUTP pyrophosphatase